VDGSKVAALGYFRELKDDPNRQLTELTFHSIEEKKTRDLGLIAKDNVAEQASIITDNIMRKQDMAHHQGNSGVSLSFGLQLICDTYGCGDQVDDEDADEDDAEDADEEGEEAASNDDIPTRTKTAPEEVRMWSIWQSGQANLTLPREQWLFSLQFEDTMLGEEMKLRERSST
jgi:hypothetical protein